MTSTNVFVDSDFVVVKPKINDLHNHFHNILRLFDVLSNFAYTPSETMLDYYLWKWYIGVANDLKLSILGN